jgi:hypothetical protein
MYYQLEPRTKKQRRTFMTRPKVGWGILSPDNELSEGTLKLVDQLSNLPAGQLDALLIRAVPRYLYCELKIEENQEPDRSQMVTCSSSLANLLNDILGRP